LARAFANSDHEIGQIISEAMEKVGKVGKVGKEGMAILTGGVESSWTVLAAA
jgi:hypothetical protein